MALAALLALFDLRFKADIFIADSAETFLAYGFISLLLSGVFAQNEMFQSPGISSFLAIDLPDIAALPFLGKALTSPMPLVSLASLLMPVIAWMLARTR